MNVSRLSIRARITGGSLLIAILLSTAAGLLIYDQVVRIVHNNQIQVLESVQAPYVTAIEEGETEEFDPPGPGQFAAIVTSDGTVALDTLPVTLADDIDALASGPDGAHTIEADDTAYLVMVTSVAGEGGNWHVITATEPDTDVLNQVALLLVASIALINIGFGVAAWLIGSAALSPVTRLRRSAEQLATTAGSELLPVGPARDEISELAHTLNELIIELRASADRERQIVSDASHEFRTPLAILQTRLELAQREAQTLAEMKADVSAAQKTLGRLSALATAMLELSRLDAHGGSGMAGVSDLATELSDAADRGRLRAAGRDIRIDYADDTSTGDRMVRVSEADFGRVCDNLVGNGLAAIRESGSIELRLVTEREGVRLTVDDDGGGMDEGYVPFAFERFSRENAARTEGGAGLGLPIVAAIAANSGGTIRLDNDRGVGLHVEITFPFASSIDGAGVH